MLNDTLLTASILNSGTHRVPDGRFGDAYSNKSLAVKDPTNFEYHFRTDGSNGRDDAIPLRATGDRAFSAPIRAVPKLALPNEELNDNLSLIVGDSAVSGAETVDTSTEVSWLSNERQRSLKSRSQFFPNPEQGAEASPAILSVTSAELSASQAFTQSFQDRAVPQATALLDQRASAVFSETTGPIPEDATALSSITQPLRTFEPQRAVTVESATTSSRSGSNFLDGLNGNAIVGVGDRETSQFTYESQRYENAVLNAGPETSPAATPEWRSTPFGLSVAFGSSIRPAISEQAALTQDIRVIFVSKLTDNDFEFRLDPPDLGSVTLHFYEDETGLQHATITSERSDTLDLLRRHSDVLQRELFRAGVGSVELGFQEPKGDGRRDDRASNENGARLTITPQQLDVPAAPLLLPEAIGRIDRFA